MKILVTGGTGALGRVVVSRLLADNHDVTVASRRARPDGVHATGWTTVDYRTGAGLPDAVHGVDTIVHCAYSYRGIDVERRLVAAAQRSDGDPHIVFISIVGIDRIPFVYYRAKLAAEELIVSSGLPWTALRTTQFHDLVRVLLALGSRAPVMPVLDLPVQPVDATDVATRLAALAVGEPAGHADELGGPQVHDFRDLARTFLEVTGRRRAVTPIRLPGKAFRAFHAGGILTPEHAEGTITFEDYLRKLSDPATTSYRGVR